MSAPAVDDTSARTWRDVHLVPLGAPVWDDDALSCLEWLVGRLLADHRHRCRRSSTSLVVSVGPPDAARVVRRLTARLHSQLGALTHEARP